MRADGYQPSNFTIAFARAKAHRRWRCSRNLYTIDSEFVPDCQLEFITTPESSWTTNPSRTASCTSTLTRPGCTRAIYVDGAKVGRTGLVASIDAAKRVATHEYGEGLTVRLWSQDDAIILI